MGNETLTKLKRRQLDVLKKLYEVDEEKKVVKVTLHYEKASDILISDLCEKDKPVFGRTIMDRIEELVSLFPGGYKLDLQLQLDDYEGYSVELLNSYLSNYLELEHYRSNKEIKRIWMYFAVLAFIGACLLVVLALFIKSPIHKGNLIDYVFDYFCETLACAFMWEAISSLLFYPPEFLRSNFHILQTLNSVSFLDSNKKVLLRSDKKRLLTNLVYLDGKNRTGNTLLIIGGSIQFVLGTIGLVNFFTEMKSLPFSQSQIVACSVLVCIVSVVEVLLGIASINYFRMKGPLKKRIVPLCIILFAFFAGYMIAFIIAWQRGTVISAAMVASFIIGVLNTAATLVGAILAKSSLDENN